MAKSGWRRGVLVGLSLLLLAALASTAASGTENPPETSEVWVADQGTNKIHILSPQGEVKETLNLN